MQINNYIKFIARTLLSSKFAQMPIRGVSRILEFSPPRVTIFSPIGNFVFFTPNTTTYSRAKTLLSKEPETIEWIDSFSKNDVLWDIGANVGCYSLYAARRGNCVMAFEPDPANFYALSKNIEMNGQIGKIDAYCISFAESSGLNRLYKATNTMGGSYSSFGSSVNWEGKEFSASFIVSSMGFSIDQYVDIFNPVFPNHIKIDVDGNEHKILKGATKALSNKTLKTILIELNKNRSDFADTLSLLNQFGFRETQEKLPCSIERTLRNYIFVRC